ncbi:MAG: alpha/beta fold hydrolase [Bacillota bacterium]|nr:alpha/beta fold hydrolase [Bacillota bacterium]
MAVPSRRAGGSPLHLRSVEPPDPDPGRPVLLLLPGAGADHRSWGAELADWGRSWRVLAPDPPGTGRSAGPLPADWEELLAAYAPLAEAAGPGRLVLVGLSLGSRAALSLAARLPRRPAALVLVHPWLDEDGDLRERRRAVAEMVRWAPETVYSRTLAWFLGSAELAEDPDRLERLAAAWRPPAGPPREALLAYLELAPEVVRPEAIPAVPALVVAGEQDRMIPARYSRQLADRLPGARWLLFRGPGSGHLLHLERAGEFRRAVRTFLEEVLEAPAPAGAGARGRRPDGANR